MAKRFFNNILEQVRKREQKIGFSGWFSKLEKEIRHRRNPHLTVKDRVEFTHKILKNFLKDKGTIIDIGISTGETTEFLQKAFQNYKIIGTEIDETTLRKAEGNLSETDIVVSPYDFTSKERPPFENIDAVRSCHMFFYLSKEEKERFFRNAFKALKPDGILLLTFGFRSILLKKKNKKFKLFGLYSQDERTDI
ncbi:MAG: class I SAM-dependent methyltransferase [Candidatus Undinarchaeales archaeon]